MSLLVRAAILGGLAYVVSRAVRGSAGSNYLNRSDTSRLSRSFDQDPDDAWPRSDQPSTSTL